MQIIRFYAMEGPAGIQPLAKYKTDADKTQDDIRDLCRTIIEGAHSCTDTVEFFNAKFAILDKTIADYGFERVNMIDPENLDAKCALVFDVVVNADERTVKIFTFDVKPYEKEPFYLKSLADTYTLGQLVH